MFQFITGATSETFFINGSQFDQVKHVGKVQDAVARDFRRGYKVSIIFEIYMSEEIAQAQYESDPLSPFSAHIKKNLPQPPGNPIAPEEFRYPFHKPVPAASVIIINSPISIQE